MFIDLRAKPLFFIYVRKILKREKTISLYDNKKDREGKERVYVRKDEGVRRRTCYEKFCAVGLRDMDCRGSGTRVRLP